MSIWQKDVLREHHESLERDLIEAVPRRATSKRPRARRVWAVAALAALMGLGCDGSTATTHDGGTTPGTDGGTTPGTDGGAGPDGATGPSGGWTLRAHPCVGNRTDTLWRDDDGTLFVGCGSTTTGLGIFVSRDEGATWNRPATNPNGFFETWRVLDVSRSANGLLYVGGIDTASSRRVVSADTSGATWALEEVYNAGTTVGSAFTVGRFRRNSAGMAVAESLNGTDIQVRRDDASEWRDMSDWGSDFGGLQILDMEVHEDRFYGVGSTISQPPYLYLPLEDDTRFGFRVINLAGTGIGAYRGEMWGIDVDGSGIVAGGVNQDRDVGMIYALDGANATTLRTFDVSQLFPERSTWVRGVCRRGQTLLAVGERSTESIGFVLRSDDNGGSWRDITPDTGDPRMPFPPVHQCRITPSGHSYVAGADGMLAIDAPR